MRGVGRGALLFLSFGDVKIIVISKVKGKEADLLSPSIFALLFFYLGDSIDRIAFYEVAYGEIFFIVVKINR